MLNMLGLYFKGRKDVAFAYLFGSVAKDRAHSESDVDIGVYFVPNNSALEYESKSIYANEDSIWRDLDALLGRRVDFVVLNRAASTVVSAVMHEGEKIFSRDEALLSRLSGAVDDLAEDFRYFISDFMRIKQRSKSLSQNDRPRLERIVDFMQDQMPEFKDFSRVTQMQYQQDVSIKRNLERWAETVANASIDIAKILIASAKKPMPQTYKAILEDLALLDGFDRDVALKLASFSDMRNILSHEYFDMKFAILERFAKTAEPLFACLIQYAKSVLEKDAKK